MADDSLSDSYVHTIHFTHDEYKKHQRLIYIGSVMSNFLRNSSFIEPVGANFSYAEGLREVAQFLESGGAYSDLWDDLARDMQRVYDVCDRK